MGIRTALVTGASNGIGYELAKLLAADGHRLILVARRRQRLEVLARELRERWSVEVEVLTSDLSLPNAPEEIFREVQVRGSAPDILVNNAAFGVFGHFSAADAGLTLSLLQLNVVALTHLTKLFLPSMIERCHGRILNVASTGAFQAGPLMSTYYASKAYVLSFSEAIANEVKGTGVTVTCLCPGPTATEFHERAGMMDSRLLIPGRMSAATVARIGYVGMLQGKRVVIPGFVNRILVQLVRIVPRALASQIVRTIQERRRRRE